MIITDCSVENLADRRQHLHPVSYLLWSKQRFGTDKFESKSFNCEKFYSRTFSHPLVDAADIAFNNHLPLRIRPDDFWIAILQGFSTHVSQNPEKYRKLFVNHGGNIDLVVRRDFFIKGNSDNDWQNVFSEFVNEIRTYLSADKSSTLTSAFSTSSNVDISCFNVGVMNAMSSYFRYIVRTLCGIPEFHVMGTVEDWVKLRDNFEVICSWFIHDSIISNWKNNLLPILELIIQSFSKIDLNFWKNLYHEDSESGSLLVTGWIQYLFPYIKLYNGKIVSNKFKSWTGSIGTDIGSLPSGLSEVPFIWKYLNEDFQMKFITGHIGVVIEDDIVFPITGWIVKNQ